MKKILFTFCLFSIPVFTFCQDNLYIIGKWKVIKVNDGVIHDYKTDSVIITKELTDTLTGKKDSMLLVEMMKAYASTYKDYYLVFDKDGKYEEIRNGATRSNGKYEISEKERLIKVTLFLKDGTEKKGEYEYEFQTEGLQIKISSPDGPRLIMLLEKVL